nr:hypothetical protein [Tanacetum cinerariifolium]
GVGGRRAQHQPRVRPVGNHHRRPAAGPCYLPQPRQNALVPNVDTIKGAAGDDGIAKKRKLGRVADDVHRAPEKRMKRENQRREGSGKGLKKAR